ncbi:Acyl-CoA dehydrogenase [Labilithrix luteola]|uniref:Acyl-CoA dehydrogenase n=1 Tax=Labilithrix luteola TaxID=1391654 RepID=A0A0K1PZP6_9BACT|nr:acyl-CoA dehydrogenase family protein [Labilithrix luteola]AKU98998.1 Acyl-CoA dehydrogenase [Labilithrix luteola]
MPNILVYMLTAPISREGSSGLPRWLDTLEGCPFNGHVERALWGGFHADRLGYAFVAGYEAALGRLFEHASAQQPEGTAPLVAHPGGRRRLALGATEAGGAHPRAITTRLDKEGGALVLRGEKTFVTLAPVADAMLVVASRGPAADGTNRLRLVRVSTSARGLRIEPRKETPFAPEIPHARVTFENVVVEPDAVLPGDGYAHWLKPFRTIEDVHVLAAAVGYLLGVSRAHGWDRAVATELASLALSLVDLGARDPSNPLTHVLLAGTFSQARHLVERVEPFWAKTHDEERDRWQRDRPLLDVAEMVRQKRTQAAFEALGMR